MHCLWTWRFHLAIMIERRVSTGTTKTEAGTALCGWKQMPWAITAARTSILVVECNFWLLQKVLRKRTGPHPFRLLLERRKKLCMQQEEGFLTEWGTRQGVGIGEWRPGREGTLWVEGGVSWHMQPAPVRYLPCILPTYSLSALRLVPAKELAQVQEDLLVIGRLTGR